MNGDPVSPTSKSVNLTGEQIQRYDADSRIELIAICERMRHERNAAHRKADGLKTALEELRDEVEAIMHGEHGADWADHFAPLFNLIQGAKALSGEPGSAVETSDGPGEEDGPWAEGWNTWRGSQASI